MLWTADSIHDFAKADRQKSPSEELIVSWPLHWMTFLKRWSSAVFRVFPNHEVLRYFFVTTSAVFLPPFFSFESTVPKQGCVLYTGAHYTRVNTVFFTPKFTAWIFTLHFTVWKFHLSFTAWLVSCHEWKFFVVEWSWCLTLWKFKFTHHDCEKNSWFSVESISPHFAWWVTYGGFHYNVNINCSSVQCHWVTEQIGKFHS